MFSDLGNINFAYLTKTKSVPNIGLMLDQKYNNIGLSYHAVL